MRKVSRDEARPEPERRRWRLGEVVLSLPAPAQATNQAAPLPGTRWRDAPGRGCELLVVDESALSGFVAGSGGRVSRRWAP